MTSDRICTVCGEHKKITEFPKNGRDKHGQTRYRPDCKTCYGITRKLKKKKITKFLNNTKHRTGEEKSYLPEDWKDALVYFRGCCAYCGTKQSRRVKLTKDHVVPVSQKGLTVRNNIIPACTKCNSSKSNTVLEEWYPKQKHYSKEREERIKGWIEQ